MNYHEYIRSPEWKTRSDAAKRRAGWRCQLCKSSASKGNPLDTHHNTYDHLGAEMDEDLIVLCRKCHQRHHDVLPKHNNKRICFGPSTEFYESLPADKQNGFVEFCDGVKIDLELRRPADCGPIEFLNQSLVFKRSVDPFMVTDRDRFLVPESIFYDPEQCWYIFRLLVFCYPGYFWLDATGQLDNELKDECNQVGLELFKNICSDDDGFVPGYLELFPVPILDGEDPRTLKRLASKSIYNLDLE